MQEENTKINTSTTEQNTFTENEGRLSEIDPIQEAYNKASYDLIKYLSGEEFPRTVELITQANKLEGEQASEVNFICLMLCLKIIKYDRETGESIMSMLSKVGLDIPEASQVWSDIEAYVVPSIPEMINYVGSKDGNTSVPEITVSRSVSLETESENGHITHFGPDSVEMRLKNIRAPRITLDQLSRGESLLSSVKTNIEFDSKTKNKTYGAVNYNSHPDPYRELVE